MTHRTRITHAVGHFNVRSEHLERLRHLLLTTVEHEKKNNIYVCRVDPLYTYSVFPSSGHVSVYRLKNLEASVANAIPCFSALFGDFCGHWQNLVVIPEVKIINISAAGKFKNRKFLLNRVQQSYNSQNRIPTASQAFLAAAAVAIVGAKKQKRRGKGRRTEADQGPYFRLTLNREVCPFLTFRSHVGGAINLFSTGRYTILGAKTWSNVEHILNQLCAFIQTL